MLRAALTVLLAIVLAVPAAPQVPASGAELPAQPPAQPARIVLLPNLTFGGELEIDYRLERDFDLDGTVADRLSLLEPDMSFAFSFDPSRRFRAFLKLELSRAFALEEEGEDEERQTSLEVAEAFVMFKDVREGLSFRIGRQQFDDDREWLFDEELDAARVFYEAAPLSLELSVSRKDLADRDLLRHDEGERIDNYLVYAGYRLTDEIEVAAYTFVRDDRSEERESPVFLGLRSSGEIADRLEYWLDLAHVRGEHGSRPIRGFGFDVGATYELALPLKPSITLGYAFGSGDANPDDGVDTNFRQTGLQENENEFNGMASLQYYGELFDPELSNLQILTGGIGLRPTRKSSADLVYHLYRQHRASASIRDSAIEADPTGGSRRLGSEIDLVFGYEGIRNVGLEMALGYFIPGSAFPGEADDALLVRVEIQVGF